MFVRYAYLQGLCILPLELLNQRIQVGRLSQVTWSQEELHPQRCIGWIVQGDELGGALGVYILYLEGYDLFLDDLGEDEDHTGHALYALYHIRLDRDDGFDISLAPVHHLVPGMGIGSPILQVPVGDIIPTELHFRLLIQHVDGVAAVGIKLNLSNLGLDTRHDAGVQQPDHETCIIGLNALDLEGDLEVALEVDLLSGCSAGETLIEM